MARAIFAKVYLLTTLAFDAAVSGKALIIPRFAPRYDARIDTSRASRKCSPGLALP